MYNKEKRNTEIVAHRLWALLNGFEDRCFFRNDSSYARHGQYKRVMHAVFADPDPLIIGGSGAVR